MSGNWLAKLHYEKDVNGKAYMEFCRWATGHTGQTGQTVNWK